MRSIEVAGLTKNYSGARPALDNVSFRYEGAGAIGYLGPNGAGKTTTLKLLTGFLRPTKGSAHINGRDVHHDRKAALDDVGAIIETPEPYPFQTVLEAIRMASDFRRGPTANLRAEVQELNSKLDLPPLSTATGKLSKGQRQRVVIAGALVGDPRVIVLDEPTSGLDPKERILIRNLLKDLKKDHLILMSSHLMQEVTEICDHLIFVNEGRVLLQDTAEEVAGRFRAHAVDVEFDASVAIDRILALEPLVQSVVSLGPARFRIAFDGTRSARGELLRALLRVDTVLNYQDASLALEDAYLSLIQGTNSQGATAPPAPAS